MLVVNEENGICGILEIFAKLKEIGYVLPQDELLTEIEKGEVLAYTALIEEKLYTCQLYDWWSESENYDNFASVAYENAYSFPLSVYMKKFRRNSILEYLNYRGYNNKERVIREVKEIYEVLSNRIGSKEFLFGDLPSSLDCILFAFLQTQSFKEVSKSILANLLKSKANLVNYCNNFMNTWYFPHVGERKSDQTMTHSPLKEYAEKENLNALAAKQKNEQGEMEKQSINIILGSVAVLFCYYLYNSSKQT
jgi:glutathione S-transferase